MLFHDLPTYLLRMARGTFASIKILGQRLKRHILIKDCTHCLLVRQNPSVKRLDGNSNCPGYSKVQMDLSLIKLFDPLFVTICIGHEYNSVELTFHRVFECLQREFEMPAAFARHWIRSRQIMNVDPFTADSWRQDAQHNRFKSLGIVVALAALVISFRTKEHAHDHRL